MAELHENPEVFRFILEEIDSVPHLEALLLLWHNRAQPWAVPGVAKRLYVNPDTARQLLLDLHRRHLIATVPGSTELYRFDAGSPEKDRLIGEVDATYRRELVRISTIIHSKASTAVREFAKAFRITKERE